MPPGQKRARDTTAEAVLLPSDKLLLETMMAEAVRPRISFSDDELKRILSRLHDDRQHYIHDRRIPAAASDNTCTSRCYHFCTMLQDICPLVPLSEFIAETDRVMDVAVIIRSTLSKMKNISQERRDQCIADGRCVWCVTWSAAVDSGLKALRVTTLGTVHDAFEAHPLAGSLCKPVLLFLTKHNARMMVSDEADSEFVTRDAEMRFVHPVNGKIMKPLCRSDPLNTKKKRSITRQLLLVCGSSGAGKTMASVYYAVVEAEQEERLRRRALLSGPINTDSSEAGDDEEITEYSEAGDDEEITDSDQVGADDTEEGEEYPGTCGFQTSDDAPPTTCVLYCKALDFLPEGSTPSAKDLFEGFVKAQLLGGGKCRSGGDATVPTDVVRSFRCVVVIVIDELGAEESFVSDLINNYRALTKKLERELKVDWVRIIGAGTGVDAFDRRVVKSDGLRKVVTRHIQTALWKRLSKYVKDHRPFLIPDLCNRIALLSADRLVVSAVLSWLRAALANARFAAVFATHMMESVSSTRSVPGGAHNARKGVKLHHTFWDQLAIEAEAAEGGLHFLALTTMHRFARLNGLADASRLFVVLRDAIGAMIDRKPPSESQLHYNYWKTFVVSYGIVTLGGVVVAGTELGNIRLRRSDLVVLRSRIHAKSDDGGGGAGGASSLSFTWVDYFAEGAVHYEVMRRGRPFFMVDRVYCSMCMFLFGGCAAGFRPPNWRGFEQAVMDFAFFAASLPCVNLEEPRIGVPPLRRLLNHLGNEESTAKGVAAWRAAPPMRIEGDTDWGPLHEVVRAKETARVTKEATPKQEDSPQQAFWRELCRCVRRGRAGVITNAEGANGADGFVIAQKLLALLQFKSYPKKTVDSTMVVDELEKMAPVIFHRDCVLVEGTGTVGEQSAALAAGEPEVERHGEGQLADLKENSNKKKKLDDLACRWKQQRVSEELVALACGVTFRRCPQTKRALVRSPTTTDTTTDTTAAPPDFVVHVAVVFEGSPTAVLQKRVLHSALGPQWSDLEGSYSGPFAATTTATTTKANVKEDRLRVEVVLDYLLDKEAPVSDSDEAPCKPTQQGPLHAHRANSDVLRVAYRYFLVDVTWRKDDAEQEKGEGSPTVRSETCSFAWDDALPPLYPVAQTLFPARQ